MEELNLKSVKCPLNFVKAKLALEKLSAGSELKIFLDLGEAEESVKKSLISEGYQILASERKSSHYELTVIAK